MASSWKMAALFVLGGIGTLVVAAAQTPVQEAKSNLSGWLTEIGFGQLPYSLTTLAADRWATLGGLALLIASGLSIFFLRKRRTNRSLSAVAQSINNDIVTAKQKTSSGDRLVDLGLDLFVYGGVLAAGVMVTGLLLMVIGQSLPTKQSSDEAKEISKGADIEITPPPIAETPKVEATAPPPKLENKEPRKPPRKYVAAHVTPEFLVNLPKAEKSIYLERWMPEVSGPMGTIEPNGYDNSSRVMFTTVTQPYVFMYFNNEWIDDLTKIPKNQIISVRGQIKVIDEVSMVLRNCEIIKPSTKPSAFQPKPTVPPDQQDR